MPFREAHEIIGKLVAFCIEKNIAIEDVEFSLLEQLSPLFESDFYDRIKAEACMGAKRSEGGVAQTAVQLQSAQNSDFGKTR
jgi:argininosuccinate lyase